MYSLCLAKDIAKRVSCKGVVIDKTVSTSFLLRFTYLVYVTLNHFERLSGRLEIPAIELIDSSYLNVSSDHRYWPVVDLGARAKFESPRASRKRGSYEFHGQSFLQAFKATRFAGLAKRLER